MTQRAVFLDKDGTLIEDVPYNVDPDRIRLMPGSGAALRRLQACGYRLIVISNQSGVARGLFPEQVLSAVERRLRDLLLERGVWLDDFYYCPHHPHGTVPAYAVVCACRKPQPGLILQAAATYNLDLEQSWFVGDILDDIQAGRSAGCRTILLDHGHETEWDLRPERLPHFVVHDFAAVTRIICQFQHTDAAAKLESLWQSRVRHWRGKHGMGVHR